MLLLLVAKMNDPLLEPGLVGIGVVGSQASSKSKLTTGATSTLVDDRISRGPHVVFGFLDTVGVIVPRARLHSMDIHPGPLREEYALTLSLTETGAMREPTSSPSERRDGLARTSQVRWRIQRKHLAVPVEVQTPGSQL